MSGFGAALRTYTGLGVSEADDDRRRLRKRSLTLVASAICLLSPSWIVTYLLLDRPLAALIPALYVALSLVGLTILFVTKRDVVFVTTQVAAMLVLPVALQWVLGGFVRGSAVGLWSFASVMVALVTWGPRAATAVFVAFATAIAVSGVAEETLRAATVPLPTAVESAFFVLNVSAPLATAFGLLVYVTRERDEAMRISEGLLHSILPSTIVRRLKGGRRAIADRHEAASVGFVDFVGFTAFADRTDAERVVDILGRAFSTLDELAARNGVEKIKTLGDGYLVAAGVTEPRPDHATALAEMALATPTALRECLADDWPEASVRIGLATGPVVAGVIGERRIGFDLWGDTVNTASRMASHAEPGTTQVTESVARELGSRYLLEPRGEVEVKGKGRMRTYLLLGRSA